MTFTSETASAAGKKGAKTKHNLPDIVSAPSDLPTEGSDRFTAAAKARWAAEAASEEHVTAYFTQGVTIEEGLTILAKMRKNCELAGHALNQRITSDRDTDRCAFCGGKKKPNKQWALIRPKRDPITNQLFNEFFCDIFCVAQMNKKETGILAVSDRGMRASDNPDLHKKPADPQKEAEAKEATAT